MSAIVPENEQPNEQTADPSKNVPRTVTEALVRLLNPITLISFIILLSVLVLIGAGLLGWDRGNILNSLAKSDYARGLITYLFAVGTIGTSVVLVLAALLGEDDIKEKFVRGKEVLSLLIGIFGTMVGFYFGSQVAAGATRQADRALELTPPIGRDATVVGGSTFVVMAHVAGGTGPYSYRVLTDSLTDAPLRLVPPNGWVIDSVPTPRVTQNLVFNVRVRVMDAGSDSTETSVPVLLNAAARTAPNAPAGLRSAPRP